jgi:hypothetical protein
MNEKEMEYSVDQLRDIGKQCGIYVPTWFKGKRRSFSKSDIIDLLTQSFNIREKADELGIFPFNRHLRLNADGKTNLLKDRYPQIYAEIHPTKNPGINIDQLTYGSTIKLVWLCLEPKCECDFHEYSTTANHRTTHGHKCPTCSNIGIGVCGCNNLAAKFPGVAKFWHPSNPLPPTAYRPYSNDKVLWICPNIFPCGCEHVYPATIKNKTSGVTGCSYCNGNRFCEHDSLLVRRPDLGGEWNHERNEHGPETYKYTSKDIVHWTCSNCEYGCHQWEAKIYHRSITGSGCPFCAKNGKPCPHNNLLTRHPDLCVEWSPSNELTPDKYTRRSGYKAEWKCRTCGHCWRAEIKSRTGSLPTGCPACSKSHCSKKQLSYIQYMEICDNVKIQCHPSEFHIPTTRYHADGYSLELNKVYEFYGDYFHGNPMVYQPGDKGIDKTMGELFINTVKREVQIRALKYNMTVMWESWWDKGIDAVIDIQRKFRAYKLRKTQSIGKSIHRFIPALSQQQTIPIQRPKLLGNTPIQTVPIQRPKLLGNISTQTIPIQRPKLLGNMSTQSIPIQRPKLLGNMSTQSPVSIQSPIPAPEPMIRHRTFEISSTVRKVERPTLRL